MNYYERHIGDYLKDTAHLSLLEHGIYGRLLDIYYSREGPLPGDQIARLVGAKTEDERASLHSVLSEFFSLVDGGWVQSRCDAEIAKYQDRQRKAKASAAASWASRRGEQPHSERIANAMPTHSEGNAPSPSPSPSPSPIPSKEKKPSASRAKRCPEPFEVTSEMRSAMQAECPGIDIDRETVGFRDWEFKDPKSDWPAAWRRWMRKARDDAAAKGGGAVLSFRERDAAAAAARVHEMTGGLASAKQPGQRATMEIFDVTPLALGR